MSIRDIPRETIIQPTKAAKKNGSLVPFCSCIFQFEQTNGPFSACQALTLLPGIMDALQKPPPPLPVILTLGADKLSPDLVDLEIAQPPSLVNQSTRPRVRRIRAR